MDRSAPKDWEKESDTLFIHKTGIRIARMTYKGKDGWFIVPVELETAVVEFEPTPEGRDRAFEAFAKGVIAAKPRKAKPAPARKAAAKPVSKNEEAGEAMDDDKDRDDDKDDDKEVDGGEKAGDDEGDEGSPA